MTWDLFCEYWVWRSFSSKITGYGLDDQGSNSGMDKYLCLWQPSRLTLGHTQPVQWLLGSVSLWVKQLKHEADQSPPSTAKVKNAWSFTSTLLYTIKVWSLGTEATFTLGVSKVWSLPKQMYNGGHFVWQCKASYQKYYISDAISLVLEKNIVVCSNCLAIVFRRDLIFEILWEHLARQWSMYLWEE